MDDYTIIPTNPKALAHWLFQIFFLVVHIHDNWTLGSVQKWWDWHRFIPLAANLVVQKKKTLKPLHCVTNLLRGTNTQTDPSIFWFICTPPPIPSVCWEEKWPRKSHEFHAGILYSGGQSKHWRRPVFNIFTFNVAPKKKQKKKQRFGHKGQS